MPISNRKSTSPARTSRHNPLQPASQSISQPWLAASNVSVSGIASDTVVELSSILAPNAQSGPIASDDGYQLRPNGSGIYVQIDNGTIVEPASIVIAGDPMVVVFTFDLSGYDGQIMYFILSPDQTWMAMPNGARLAGIIYAGNVPI